MSCCVLALCAMNCCVFYPFFFFIICLIISCLIFYTLLLSMEVEEKEEEESVTSDLSFEFNGKNEREIEPMSIYKYKVSVPHRKRKK